MGHDQKYGQGVSLSYRIVIYLDSVTPEDNKLSGGLYMEHGSKLRLNVAGIGM